MDTLSHQKVYPFALGAENISLILIQQVSIAVKNGGLFQLVLLYINYPCVFSVHLVVHSLKDLPSTLPPGMLIGAVFR